MHLTWDVVVELDKEEKADKAAVEDVASAHHLQTTCRTKLKAKMVVASTLVSQLHQEGQE